MANLKDKPEYCIIPECEKCPYPDCMYDKPEKSDKAYTQRLNMWVSYQNSCLSGNGNVFEYNHPLIGANDHRMKCNGII